MLQAHLGEGGGEKAGNKPASEREKIKPCKGKIVNRWERNNAGGNKTGCQSKCSAQKRGEYKGRGGVVGFTCKKKLVRKLKRK